jgi:hypothetical protein
VALTAAISAYAFSSSKLVSGNFEIKRIGGSGLFSGRCERQPAYQHESVFAGKRTVDR